MYKKAEKGEPDAQTVDYNDIYPDATNSLNIDYNTMYHLVETGSEITDPEMKRDVEDWNKGILPPESDHDEVIGHTLVLRGKSTVIAATNTIKLDNNETINNKKHSLVL